MIKAIFRWIKSCWTIIKGKKVYKTVDTVELPEVLSPNIVYILGENGYLWSAGLLCPCGCKQTIELSLHPEGNPRWIVTRYEDRTVTLHPSVNRQVGCRSHFFLRRGQIIWC